MAKGTVLQSSVLILIASSFMLGMSEFIMVGIPAGHRRPD